VLTVDEVVQRVDAVTTAAVQRAAERVLQEDHLRLAVVGPHSSESPLLEQLHF
jgi:predicted Zn-dependent peptidase